MTRAEPIVFGRPVISESEIAEVAACLRSGWIGAGPRLELFERRLEEYVGAPHVRCVSSCTAALTLGLLALGVGAGDEVILPAMTFVATANAVVQTGAQVVLVDSDPRSGLIDLVAAEAAIGPRTKALIVVHLAGEPMDMGAVNALRDRRALPILEDAAHALGASWDGRRIGSHGNLTAYSFQASKNLTTIAGGALTLNSEALAAEVERLANHGMSSDSWQRFDAPTFAHYEVERAGFNHNMTDVQATLGLCQLDTLDERITQRARQARRYDELLAGLPIGRAGPSPPAAHHAHHLYRVQVHGRDQIAQRLRRVGIGTGVHYRGVHLHPYYRRLARTHPKGVPVADAVSGSTLSLPLGAAVSETDQRDVAAALGEALRPR